MTGRTAHGQVCSVQGEHDCPQHKSTTNTSLTQNNTPSAGIFCQGVGNPPSFPDKSLHSLPLLPPPPQPHPSDLWLMHMGGLCT